MNKQVKAAWLKDLRSGKYRQAQGQLKTTESGRAKHCCLGVLCETYVNTVAKPQGKWQKDGTDYCFGDMADIPPASVLGWAGMSADQAEVLIAMNDGEDEDYPNGAKFYQIANYIEKNY